MTLRSNGFSTQPMANAWTATPSLPFVAAKEALADSGLQMAKENPHRVGVIVNAGMGGMVKDEREITQLYQQQKPHRVHSNFIPVITLNSASGIIAMA